MKGGPSATRDPFSESRQELIPHAGSAYGAGEEGHDPREPCNRRNPRRKETSSPRRLSRPRLLGRSGQPGVFRRFRIDEVHDPRPRFRPIAGAKIQKASHNARVVLLDHLTEALAHSLIVRSLE